MAFIILLLRTSIIYFISQEPPQPWRSFSPAQMELDYHTKMK